MESLFRARNQNGERKGMLLAESICLTIGFMCLGWFCWHFVASEVDQRWTGYKFDASLRDEEPTASGFIRNLTGRDQNRPVPPKALPADSDARTPVRVPRGETIGRIEIPRLQISAMVRQGVDDGTLSRAVGHVPYTALPGSSGNVGLAAHRDTFFRNLRGVKVGDDITIVTPEGKWQYQVDSLNIVTPRNVEVLQPTPEPALTLVTCYPFNYVGSAPDRFIVRARQVSESNHATFDASASSGPAAKSVVKKAAAVKNKSRKQGRSRRRA